VSIVDGTLPNDEHALNDLRSSLLRDRPAPLQPGQGTEAFRQHKLLASAIHRASRLDAHRSESETEAWVRYMTDHFPPGTNDASEARLLFDEWRTSLLKDDAPGPRVPITHGQSDAHRVRDPDGRLCLNLEDMWAEFERSVDHFIAYLRTTPLRRETVLKRWREKFWTVQPFGLSATASATAVTTTVAVTGTHAIASAISAPSPGKPEA
jgi:hypothetical protein